MIIVSYARKGLMEVIKHSMNIRRLYQTKKPYFYVVLLIVLFVLSAILTCRLKRLAFAEIDLQYAHKMLKEDLKGNVFLNKGKGCVIPRLHPFDRDIMKFEKELPAVTCPGNDWVECYLEECFVMPSIRKKLKDLFCVYRDIVYVNDLEHRLGPSMKLRADQKYILNVTDHVRVTCLGTSRQSLTPLQWSGYKTGFRRVAVSQAPCCGPRLNIMMLCFHSMSKHGFIRKMPRSYTVLKTMGALLLNGYNVVGEGSSAALFPILTGKTDLDFPEIRKRFTKDFIDEKRFIFRDLSKMGYRTAYFDDSRPGTFQVKYNGFQYQPTDHYLLPLLRAFVNNSKGNSTFCMQGIPFYGMLLNITHQFAQLTGNRFSFTFISDIGRDDFSMRSAADADLAFFLRRSQQGGKLKETVLFVMGDHGPSSSSARDTAQGKFEERMPLMAIVVPDSLKQTRPAAAAAMAANVDVLITPFDIHSTLTDVLGIGDQRNRYKVPGAEMERGRTLLQAIPPSRSCGEAGVLPHWCACARWHPLDPNDPLCKEIGDMVADYINGLTNDWRQLCSVQRLQSVAYVLRQSSWEYKNKTFSYYYQTKVTMTPGRAVFEVTLRQFVKSDFFAISEHDISRVNAYANESTCVTNEGQHIKKFCYCKNNSPNSLKSLFL